MSQLNRVAIFAYGVASYAVFLGTFLYAVGFIGNFAVPTALDSPAAGPWQTGLLVNLGLLLIFALQHSIMARPAFKRMITRVIPVAAERSTYVLASSIALALLFWQWRPLGGSVWNVEGHAVAKFLLLAGYGFGWALVLTATFVINHFDLFGLRQVWKQLQNHPPSNVPFVMPVLYRIVRHPLYVGWLFAFWCTPAMTVSHLVFASIATAYILVGIQLEERDLMRDHPEYAGYRRQVPMLIPGLPRRTAEIVPGRNQAWGQSPQDQV